MSVVVAGLRFCATGVLSLTRTSSSASLPQAAARVAGTGTRGMAAAAGAAGGSAAGPVPVVRGVVFDMDGTLTKPVIDFAEMYKQVGVTRGQDILAVIASWPQVEQQRAFGIIAQIEEKALQEMQLMPGLEELSEMLDSAGIPRALVTRNVSSSVEFFHRTHFRLPPFTPALSREFAPCKPDPASLLHIAEHWGVAPGELLMVGDSPKDDIVCANRAGALAVLIDTQGQYSSREELEGEQRPHHLVTSLSQLRELLGSAVELRPPQQPPRSLA